MTTCSHTTSPADNGTYHFWQVGDDHCSVSLSLLHSRAAGSTSLARRSPALSANLLETEGGHWVFDVIGEHIPNGSQSGWSCSVHGDACDQDAFADQVAGPIWQRLREAGITDRTVYAELEVLLAQQREVAA
uniref:hypothetical protein n=1 Tax=Paractinoplanes polyasparticus TaxID=2856853 RepID=UPI001C860527|nr:hypothetical protein [Actinoplanes polyasparticus]